MPTTGSTVMGTTLLKSVITRTAGSCSVARSNLRSGVAQGMLE